MNKFYQLPCPAIIAHRGACAYAPENTLAAFELAVEQGADGIEFDVKLSSDGHVVIMHDPTVNRTTNGNGLVKDMALAELKSLDAGRSFSGAFAGEPVPTLAELFERLQDRTCLNIELTNYTTQSDALPEKVAELVEQYRLYENILFSSFSMKTLKRIRQLLPNIPAGMLALRGLPGAVSRSFIGRKFGPHALHPYYTDVTRSLVAAQKAHNRKVNVWTVNDEATMRKLISFGVDGIITNDPILALRCRETR